MRKLFVLLFLSLSLLSVSIAQNTYTLKGSLTDNVLKEDIPFGIVRIKSTEKWSMTNEEGRFEIRDVSAGKYVLEISCIGYQTLKTEIVVGKDTGFLRLAMEQDIRKLSEVLVIAQEKRDNGTSSVINRKALKHLQPNSFSDILELLPGGISSQKTMTSANLIALRTPINANKFSTRGNQFNSSLGTSFVIDGIPLSNDAQLQNVSGAINHTGTTDNFIFYRNTTGKGIDMRMIATDDIEKVEVVRGIPSVRFGALTSGLINIKRAYHKKPLQIRAKANPSSKLIAAEKGFELGEKHSLNLNWDYVKYITDPRNVRNNYSRTTASLRYGGNISSPFSIKSSLDYTGSFDKSKRDSENDTNKEFYKNNYNKLRFSNTLEWLKEDSFIKRLSLYMSGSYTKEEKIISKIASGRLQPILSETTEGEFYGQFLPATYLAHLTIDGQPLTLYAKLDGNFSYNTRKTHNSIYWGTDWRYSKNFGEGQIYDITRPLYAGNGRPRRSKDIPSMQEFAFYVEDNTKVDIGNHQMEIQSGVRATTLLNLGDAYMLNRKIYYDPRFNLKWKFPKVRLFGKKLIATLYGGFGWHTKFPTLSHLYPEKAYFDVVQLNYYSQNEAIRQMQYKTLIENPTNYSLKPNRNRKIELGLQLIYGNIHLDITAYKELMKEGFRTLPNYRIINYKHYDAGSGPLPSTLTAPPTIDKFKYEEFADFWTYAQMTNGGYEEKKGIEYQLDLGRIEPIKSRVSINGAWMYMKYDTSSPVYKRSSISIGGKPYPYLGYYTWTGNKEYEQFNTNIRFDTQIDKLGLIFSSMFQIMWYTLSNYVPHTGAPDYYIDLDNKQYPFTEADKTDTMLKYLYTKPQPDAFEGWRVPISIDYNLKVTKKINKYCNLAFYVNNLLAYYPEYERPDGYKVKREISPYFGMELTVKF